jgi:hypothetical protein
MLTDTTSRMCVHFMQAVHCGRRPGLVWAAGPLLITATSIQRLSSSERHSHDEANPRPRSPAECSGSIPVRSSLCLLPYFSSVTNTSTPHADTPQVFETALKKVHYLNSQSRNKAGGLHSRDGAHLLLLLSSSSSSPPPPPSPVEKPCCTARTTAGTRRVVWGYARTLDYHLFHNLFLKIVIALFKSFEIYLN